jgi:MtrB/PioB family decaheme-associated outer membrane protein
MPDNWFHQIVGSGGVNLPANSRLMLNAAFGWGRQDDNYLPFTVNPLLADPIGLPRGDLDGKLKTRQVTARFVTRPIKNTEMNVAYRWNERDNDSPRDTYFRIRGDAEDQNTSLDPGDDPTARVNRPYSFEQHKVDVKVSYQLPRRTKLTLMYDWERTRRTYQEVNHTNEHTFGAKILTRLNRYVSAGSRYERSYRNGSDYNCVRPLIAGDPPAALAGVDVGCEEGQVFENHPGLRKYYMAKLRRNDLHSWVSITPLENLSIGGDIRYSNYDYYDSEYGLQSNRILNPGVDVSYAPLEELNFHAFYSYERTRSKLKSNGWNFLAGETDPFDSGLNWSNRDKDTFHTVGAGVDFDVIPDRFSIGLQYLYAKSKGETHTTVNSGLAPRSPFPDYETKLHDISVQGNLQITRNLSMRIGYLWEKFTSNDWAFDRVCPQCLNFSGSTAVIGSGQHAPDYKAHVVSWSMIYKFW